MAITWWGAFWNGFDGTLIGPGFNIRFYRDAGCCVPESEPFAEYLLPGDDCCQAYAVGGDQYSQFRYHWLTGCCDDPGLYWFSVQMADHDFPPQWGRLGATSTQTCETYIRSEYFDQPDWAPVYQVVGAEYDASQAFEPWFSPTKSTSWGTVKALYR